MKKRHYTYAFCECGRPAAKPAEQRSGKMDNACERCAKAEALYFADHNAEAKAARPAEHRHTRAEERRERLHLAAINRACDEFFRRRGLTPAGF